MDQVAELQASVDQLSTSVGDLKARADAHANAFQAKIDELEKQIAAGAAPDLAPLKAEVDALRGSIDAIDADPAPAPADPAPADPGATQSAPSAGDGQPAPGAAPGDAGAPPPEQQPA